MTDWLNALSPTCRPSCEPMVPGASLRLWHVAVSLDPSEVESGRRLTNAETWNGKPLVYTELASLAGGSAAQVREEVAAEAAVVQRLRNAGLDAYWSRGQNRWARWIIRNAPERLQALKAVDAQIRPYHTALSGNARGLPDIVAWDRHSDELYCIEYKGPLRKWPHHQDELKDEQVAWFATGIDRNVLSRERCAIVSWVPGPEACTRLQRQSEASHA